MLFRTTIAICVSMAPAGIGDKGRLLSGGTWFLAITSIQFLDLVDFEWHDYSYDIFLVGFVTISMICNTFL